MGNSEIQNFVMTPGRLQIFSKNEPEKEKNHWSISINGSSEKIFR